jgi:hypothetical protein
MSRQAQRTALARIKGRASGLQRGFIVTTLFGRKGSQAFDKRLTNMNRLAANVLQGPVMTSRATKTSPIYDMRHIAEEMDRLFQKQIELMKSETLVGLTPAEREEYDKVGEKIRKLFAELAKHK